MSGALHRRALHVVQNRPDAAELLSAAGAARTAVHGFGSGEPCPVELRASSRSRKSTRPLYAAIPAASVVATSGSCVATLVTSEPPPRATSAAASSSVR